MKIVLIGYGKMGALLEREAERQGHVIVGVMGSENSRSVSKKIVPNLVAEADVCIDFSHPSIVLQHIERVVSAGKPMVVGTTGWDSAVDEVRAHVERAGTGFIYGPNFSKGVSLFLKMIQQAAVLMEQYAFYDTTVVEAHHRHKADSPSGTAKAMAHLLEDAMPRLSGELSISSVRCGAIPGTHSVIFDSPVDTITVTHTARNREGFAEGAISAAEWIVGRQGFYTFTDMMDDCLAGSVCEE